MVSNSHVDDIYQEALAGGAVGGKLTGAGGGGFLLLFAAPGKQEEIKARLKKLLYVPFKFEFSGSQIIFFSPETDYLAEEKTRDKNSIEAFQELKCGQTE